MATESKQWTLEVSAHHHPWQLKFKEIWEYRDLLTLFVRRDLVTTYKQTIFGPLWYLIQPLLTTLIFTLIFDRIAGISTEGIPPLLFYLSGIVLWSYFASCVQGTSDAFRSNQEIFGKVYFPRVIIPMATVSSHLLKFLIQILLLAGFWIFYSLKGAPIAIDISLLLFPLLVIMAAGLSLGFGMLISSLTTKYRDLNFLVQFGIQLAMYTTPVIYPLSSAPATYRIFILANPMSSLIEAFRYMLLGAGSFNWGHLTYSLAFTAVIFFSGILVFNRTERKFMDTV